MNKNFKANERELVKVATFFKRKSKQLIDEGKLGEEHKKVEDAVDRFIEQMNYHADNRAIILEQRESLKKLVKDDAECPNCHKRDMLKVVGTEKSEKGWKSNRYRCRRCNIEFTWNRPNNPWDLLEYINEVVAMLRARAGSDQTSDEEKLHIQSSIQSMEANLERLQPVIEAHEKEFKDLEAKDLEMEKLIHEFKNSLLIEKIKLDTWENKTKK